MQNESIVPKHTHIHVQTHTQTFTHAFKWKCTQGKIFIKKKLNQKERKCCW